LIGIALGGIFAAFFTRYNKISATGYSATIFGVGTNVIITTLLIVVLVGGIVGLASMAIVVRDHEYIMTHPVEFTVETLLMGFLPAIAFMYVMYCREPGLTKKNYLEAFLLALKFMTLNVLLQVSGFYRHSFPHSIA